MKILITGASGFIGSNITKRLVQNHEVIAIGSRSENKVQGVKLFVSTHLQGIDWDRIPHVDAVIHQAANNDTLCQDEQEIMRSNVGDTKLLLEKMYEKGCKRFICASSTAVYGNEAAPYKEESTKCSPLNLYGKSKVAMEQMGQKFSKETGVIFIALRYCNVYGPGESHKGHRASMIYQLIKQMAAKQSPKLFKHGEQKRDWIYVNDIVKANLCALEYPRSNIFNCGTGQACSFKQLVNWINDELGEPWPQFRIVPTYIDNPNEAAYQTYTECDMRKAKRELGFVPETTTENGVKFYMKYLRPQ